MPAPTGLLGKLAYAIICGIVMFLVVLGLGLLIIHFITTPEGADYGATVKGLSVILGVLTTIVVFFSGWSWPHRPV